MDGLKNKVSGLSLRSSREVFHLSTFNIHCALKCMLKYVLYILNVGVISLYLISWGEPWADTE